MAALAWFLCIALLIVGFAGAWLPMLPGLPLMVAGVVIHKLILPDVLSWWTIAVFALTALIALGLDFIATAFTSKLAGASKAGITCALIGGVVGLFFGLPGLLIGPFVGALIAELFIAKKQIMPALKSGLGAALGILAGTLGKGLLATFLLIWFVLDAWIF
jgi:uncharacterized protein